MTHSLANEQVHIKLHVLLSVRENICIMLHNSKYYMKSSKSNTDKSKNIVDLFKKAGEKRSAEEELDSNGEESEKSSDIETYDEVYAGYNFSSFVPWSILLRNFYISLSSETG